MGPFGRVRAALCVAAPILTIANQKGPIGTFHLTIDKGVADNLVSFCGKGVTRTSPTTFNVAYKNYTPTRDVDVMIQVRPTPD